MISKIRVEARAASMEEAEREIEGFIAHAKQAGFLEGICPQSSYLTDHHFGIPKPSDKSLRDREWDALGLAYEGRVVYSFEPERIEGGGLKLYGYRVERHDTQGPPDSWPQDNGQDITEQVIVLERRNPVAREHSWEGSSNFQQVPDESLSSHNRCREALVNNRTVEVWWRGESFEKATTLVGYVMPAPQYPGYSISTSRDILYHFEVELREDADREKEADRVLDRLAEWARNQPSPNSTTFAYNAFSNISVASGGPTGTWTVTQ